MMSFWKSSRRLFLLVSLVLGAAACGGQQSNAVSAAPSGDSASVAVSGGGITVDVIATNSWPGGFNGAVRITNTAFSAPITSFSVVFKMSGTGTVAGTSWNGDISAPDGSGNRTATNPNWLQYQPIRTGASWDVGFNGGGTFSGATIVSVTINGQSIPIGGNPGDTTPPTVSLVSSAISVTAAGSITLTASASDNVGVSRVEFYEGSTLLATDSSAPYTTTVAFTSANNGTHSFTARAFDPEGNSTLSSAVLVTVNISGGGSGPVYTAAGGKFLKDGAEIKLFGLNWFGMETPNRVLHGLWTGRQLDDFLSDFKSKGFNALRLPLSPEVINPGYAIDSGPYSGNDCAAMCNKDGRTALEYTLARAQAAGMYVLLDFHTCNPANLGSGLPGTPIGCSGYSLAKWLADLQVLATLSKSYANVIGIDLTNEPWNLTWSAWSSYASQGGQAVLSVNPNTTVWVEGIGNASTSGVSGGANWGQNLYEAGAISGVPASKLVYTPHSYGPSVAAMSYFGDAAFPSNMPAIWDTLFGHLVNQGYTVVVGEFGGQYTGADKTWQDAFVTYLIGKNMKSSFYWCVNPNSGDTGGVLEGDWRTWNTGKLTLLQRLMQ